jgi:hypothetical protein
VSRPVSGGIVTLGTFSKARRLLESSVRMVLPIQSKSRGAIRARGLLKGVVETDPRTRPDKYLWM